MVRAHAMKIVNACMKCRMFFVRPRLPPDGRGIWNFILMLQGCPLDMLPVGVFSEDRLMKS
jgi:hypothetical protein